jgi:hypothetical protein
MKIDFGVLAFEGNEGINNRNWISRNFASYGNQMRNELNKRFVVLSQKII